MSHRFSNPARVREDILQQATRQISWEDIPQEMRVTILEHILDCVEEVLNDL